MKTNFKLLKNNLFYDFWTYPARFAAFVPICSHSASLLLEEIGTPSSPPFSGVNKDLPGYSPPSRPLRFFLEEELLLPHA